MRTVGMRAAVSCGDRGGLAALLLAGCGSGSGGRRRRGGCRRRRPASGRAVSTRRPTRASRASAGRLHRQDPGCRRARSSRCTATEAHDLQATVVLYTQTRTAGSASAPGPRTTARRAGPPSTTRTTAVPGRRVHPHDAGGLLADPGTRLPYTRSTAFSPTRPGRRTTRHDFDYVIAIDYNRDQGHLAERSTRPQGEAKGGGIWLHMDHGSGTSACVSVSRNAMRYCCARSTRPRTRSSSWATSRT